MNGVYPGRGAKAYAPLRASPQCVKRSRTTCTASSQCVKRLCNTCAAPSQCAKRLCNTCAAPSQCAKRLCNTCTAPSQCVKRLCNTCTALSQCAPLPRGQSFIPAGCLGGECNSPLHGYPAKLRCPRRGRPYHGDNHSSLRDVWGAYAIRPLHVSGKLRCPRRGRPYPGTIIWPRVIRQTSLPPQTPSPPPQLLGIVNA